MQENKQDDLDKSASRFDKNINRRQTQIKQDENDNTGLDEIIVDDYNVDKYLEHINKFGLEKTWNKILEYTLNQKTDGFLNPSNFGSLYELGLAEQDKSDKKKSGQYYTPYDVSRLMAEWLRDLDGVNICDVGCGTGNLIMAYLELLEKEEVIGLLKDKKIYLYDFDSVAIKIAQHSIALTYGLEYLDNINVIYGDFLDKSVKIPPNSKIISNPPYAKFTEIKKDWANTKIQKNTKEFYAAFMEKILNTGNKAVIITPYSFLGGSKFQSLRDLLSEHNGFIVAFDNVPGNIFNGRKHGIFNTNTANSVRAAITVVENRNNIKGFRTSPLIRFKNEERESLLESKLLKKQISKKYQNTNNDSPKFARIHVELEDCFTMWQSKSTQVLKDFITTEKTEFTLYMPNTCRYYTTASKKELKRGGYMTISVNNHDKFNYLYSLINSSFIYWWWRIYDGGITYPVGLLNSVPLFYSLLTREDKEFLSIIVKEMIKNEDKFTVTKMNAGNVQENIKFPKKYRKIINERFLKILSCNLDANTFDLVHQNSFFGYIEDEDEDE